jgi:hypothetical protein
MRSLLLTLLLLTLSPLLQAQESDSPKPDRWHGLVLEASTPDDAIKILGQPKSDRESQLFVLAHHQWLTKAVKEKQWRIMEFHSVAGVDKAWLAFDKNELVSIMLDVKKGISPMALSNIYGIEFVPDIGSTDIAFEPHNYERNQGRVYPKTYPTVYNLVGVAETSFVFAMIGNVPSFGGALARSAGVPDQPGTFPGRVSMIQLISRKLQNRDGADVLK